MKSTPRLDNAPHQLDERAAAGWLTPDARTDKAHGPETVAVDTLPGNLDRPGRDAVTGAPAAGISRVRESLLFLGVADGPALPLLPSLGRPAQGHLNHSVIGSEDQRHTVAPE
jgi:hypothetical protein